MCFGDPKLPRTKKYLIQKTPLDLSSFPVTKVDKWSPWLSTFCILTAAMSGSIVGAPLNWDWRSRSSCCLHW